MRAAITAGFLGSGKTTLVRHILTGAHGFRIAVILNEYGEDVGIESSFVQDQQVGAHALYTQEVDWDCAARPTRAVQGGSGGSREGCPKSRSTSSGWGRELLTSVMHSCAGLTGP